MSDSFNKPSKNTVNSSGFPLQLGAIHTINESFNWKVALEEHPWSSEEVSGYIDIIAFHKTDVTALVIECKRVRDTTWVFLIPKTSPRSRSHAMLWCSSRIEAGWQNFQWKGEQAEPSSDESEYCSIPGQEKGRLTLLERTASTLVDSVESFAIEEKLLKDWGRNVFSRIYIPVIVTTAVLQVAYFSPADVSLHDGSLPNEAVFSTVPFIRFRKSFSTRPQLSPAVTSVEELHRASERTIFVVNAESLPQFLNEFEVL